MGKRINTATWHEKHKRWQIKVQKDGERRAFYSGKPGRTGQRECNAKADAWLDDGLVSTEIRADKLYAEWLSELKATTGTEHWTKYDSLWRTWIAPRIARLRMGSITEQHLQNVILDAHKKGRAKKTLSNLRACMSAFIKYARKRKATTLIVENVYIPKDAPVGERIILQPDDLDKLFSADTTVKYNKRIPEPLTFAFRLEVVTGLRPGELLGLEWGDIKGSRIMVRRSFNNSGEFTKGKNENAIRDFTMPEYGTEVLSDYRTSMGNEIKFSKYVFPASDGEPLSQSTYRKRWIRYCESNGLSKGVRPYDLRHTFVSIHKEMPEGLLKALVGHSVRMNTYATYSHKVTGDEERAAELMQSRLQELLEKGK